MGQRGGAGVLWAALLSAALGALIALPWEGTVDTQLTRDASHDAEICRDLETAAYTRTTEYIDSHGTRLQAWVYIPKGLSSPPPVVLMAHGLGVQKDIGLPPYAERFAKHALAVVLFDYRTFGGSDGEPRQWVSSRRHLEDYAAVVQHVKLTNLGGRVDGGRIALWGVSFSGGHSLVTAARMGDAIKAVVANEPYLAPPNPFNSTDTGGLRRPLRLLAASISDELRRLLGLPPVYVQLAARIGGNLSLVPLKDSDLAHSSVVRGGPAARHYLGGWKNKVLARMVLETLRYRPERYAEAVKCPVFLRAGTRDHIVSIDLVKAVAKRLGGGHELQVLEASHVEAHPMGVKKEFFEPVVTFLHRHLGVTSDDAAAAAALAERAAAAEAAAAAAEAGDGAAQEAAADEDEVPEGQFPMTD